MEFGLDIWKNKETYDYHRNYNGVGDEPEEPIYANTFKGEWFAKKMAGRDRVETDTTGVCLAASQAYGDYKTETNREEKKEIPVLLILIMLLLMMMKLVVNGLFATLIQKQILKCFFV